MTKYLFTILLIATFTWFAASSYLRENTPTKLAPLPYKTIINTFPPAGYFGQNQGHGPKINQHIQNIHNQIIYSCKIDESNTMLSHSKAAISTGGLHIKTIFHTKTSKDAHIIASCIEQFFMNYEFPSITNDRIFNAADKQIFFDTVSDLEKMADNILNIKSNDEWAYFFEDTERTINSWRNVNLNPRVIDRPTLVLYHPQKSTTKIVAKTSIKRAFFSILFFIPFFFFVAFCLFKLSSNKANSVSN